MNNEIWKLVVGFEQYEVSSEGRIRNARFNKVLTPWKRGDYLSVDLYKNGRGIHYDVHRIVAIAFCPNLNGSMVVNHINSNKYDNRPENLEWVTFKENLSHHWSSKCAIGVLINDLKNKISEEEWNAPSTLGECIEKIKMIYSGQLT